MADADLKTRVERVRQDLEAIERALAQGAVPRRILEAFKTAVDDVRIHTWAALTGAEGSPAGHDSIVAQYRLGRMVELCQHVVQDLDARLVPPGHAGLLELQTGVERLLASIKRVESGQ